MKLTLGFSPCPNDTFIFDALIHHKIDTEGLTFEPVLLDVEALNRKAFQTQLDITKLSYHAYAFVQKDYILSDAGSALGNQCGPMVIASQPFQAHTLTTKIIAIPGKYTTANFLLNYYLQTLPDYKPQTGRHIAMVFSEIMPSVQKGKTDAGVIIHENRFTYMNYGLYKIIDLGDFWEKNTKFPIPLGGIVLKRTLPKNILQTFNRVLRKSIEYAFQNPESSKEYVKTHAQETDNTVIQQHIDLYVNSYSIDVGKKGKEAIKYMLQIAEKTQNITDKADIHFISDIL